MKLWIFLILNLVSSFNFPINNLNVVDKHHIKTYVKSWNDIWKYYSSPISHTRICEGWSCILWCIRYNDKDNYHSLSYQNNNYIILMLDDYKNKNIRIQGILESPDNIYNKNQINNIYNELNYLTNKYNYSLDLSPLRNWSHGFYLYEYK